jgi:urease accessory protein
MRIESLAVLLQFTDGLFPAGGYAHSFGLETYVQEGAVRDHDGVLRFLQAYLDGSAGPSDAVAVVLAWERARADDLRGLLDLDARLDAMRPAAELREASRQMGRQTLRVAASLMEDAPAPTPSPVPRQRRFHAEAEAGRTPGHHPVVFGAVGGTAGWDKEASALAYLHAAATVVVGAALRLLPLGQLEGQGILASVRPLIVRLAQSAAGAGPDDLWGFTPGLDAASMRHARLEARLFRS